MKGRSIYKLFLAIPAVPDSLNKALRAGRFGNHRKNNQWDLLIAAEVSGQRPPAALARAEIFIERHAHRMLDFDGLVGSMKPVVDAIVDAGILKDDSWKVLGAWNVKQTFRPKSEGVMLEIYIEERELTKP